MAKRPYARDTDIWLHAERVAAELLTPPSIVAVLGAGYLLFVHPSASPMPMRSFG